MLIGRCHMVGLISFFVYNQKDIHKTSRGSVGININGFFELGQYADIVLSLSAYYLYIDIYLAYGDEKKTLSIKALTENLHAPIGIGAYAHAKCMLNKSRQNIYLRPMIDCFFASLRIQGHAR